MSKIYISAGHGGSDPGAVSNGRKEKDFTLPLALEVKRLLDVAGHTTYIDRRVDCNSDINDKVKFANDTKVDVFVDLHLNAGGGTGVEVYHSKFGGTGQTLAERICSAVSGLGFRYRGPKTKLDKLGRDYFGIIRLTKMPAVLVECCFIDNADDMRKYNAPVVAQTIANGILSLYPAVIKPAPVVAPVTSVKAFEVGDKVQFTGGKHYANSNALVGSGGNRTAGTAKITNIRKGAKRPYHIVGEGKCNVYGWVNAEQIK